MEVFDNSEQTCGDDYGSIVLTQSLAAWETLCVSTFEQDKTATKYQQEFFKLNGLDGKISSIILKNTGNVNNNDYNRCHTDSSAIFLEGNSCTSGGIVKSVAFPSAGQHSKITGYSNDAARSVLLTGPLTVSCHCSVEQEKESLSLTQPFVVAFASIFTERKAALCGG